jgi:ketosteroid isomerase-like protein
MSQENVEIVRELAEAVNRRDLNWLVAHADEELEFIPLRAGTEGAFRGPEGLRRFIEDTQESFDVFEVSLDDLRAVGEQAVVGWGTLRIRGRGSGIETEVTTAAVARLRDGRLLRFKDYGDKGKALEAAGLSE